MARLNLILESLLRDIIEAQHTANCHAASLSRQYGKNGSVRGFRFPSAQIGSLELNLNYAVTNTSGVEERLVLDVEQWSLFRQEAAERFPAYMIRSIVMTVAHSELPDDEIRSDFNRLMAREEQWKKGFCDFLQGKIGSVLSDHGAVLIKEDSGLDKRRLKELLAGVGEKEVLDNPDLIDLFQGNRSDDLRQECRENLLESLASFIDLLAEKYSFVKSVINVVVEVEVETDKLKKLPENTVQTLKFNVMPSAAPAVLSDQQDLSFVGGKP